MKGFRRNVKLLMGWWHQVQIVIYLLFLLILTFFRILDKEGLPLMVEEIPMKIIILGHIKVLITLNIQPHSIILLGQNNKDGMKITRHL